MDMGYRKQTFITLFIIVLNFIPKINMLSFFVSIWFGINGNRWALENKEWQSVEHFQRVQRNWVKACAIYILAISFIIMFYGIFVHSKIEQAEHKAYFALAHQHIEDAISESVLRTGRFDMSSNTNLERYMSTYMQRYMEREMRKGSKSMNIDFSTTYKFNCNNTGCLVYADINGAKGPNEVTKNAKDLKDIITFKIVRRQNGSYEVLKPKFWNELFKL